MSQPTSPISEVFGIQAPKGAVIRVHSVGDPFAAEADQGYLFDKNALKVAQFWLRANPSRGMMLTGPTGSGKTAFVEEISKRTRWPFVVVGCHGELEFQDLVGRITLNKDGSTGWVDGPLVRAMKLGAILLLDEINFLRPSAVGGMNGVLDARMFQIPETGEEVAVHPDFRIAATANSISGDDATTYRGTQRQNVALLDRFIGHEMGYLPEDDEVKALMGRVQLLKETVARVMVSFANGVRSMNKDGKLLETLSFRVLHTWAEFTVLYDSKDEQAQAQAMTAALQPALLFRCSMDSQRILETALRETGQRYFPQVF